MTSNGHRAISGGARAAALIIALLACALLANAQLPSFFTGATVQPDGSYYLQLPNGTAFGFYTILDASDIWHFDLGYEIVEAGTGSDLYLYDVASQHWWYTNPTSFPYLYDFTLGQWIYYFPNTGSPGRYTSNPRWFVSTTGGQPFTLGDVAITVTSASPAGLPLTVDGTQCTSPCSYAQWTQGTDHTIAALTQPGTTGSQYVFLNWSDAGALQHTINLPATSTTYTATFQTQYQLTNVVSPANAGIISSDPMGPWYNSGTQVNLTAVANSGYEFAGWSGSGGLANPTSVTMNSAQTMTASFASAVRLNIPTLVGYAGTCYAVNLSQYASGGVGAYAFSAAPSQIQPLTLTSAGVLSGTLPTLVGPTRFGQVSLTDGVGGSATQNSFTIDVNSNPQPLSITTRSLPSGTVGTPYSTTLSAQGGSGGQLTWSLYSGSLPTGLTLNASTGVISGTPNGADSFSFSVTVTDGCQLATPEPLILMINPAGGYLTVQTTSLPSGTIGGSSYSATLHATGGTSPYTWSVSSGSLPNGLSLNASSGLISGTLSSTATTSTDLVFKVTDSSTPTPQTASTQSLILQVTLAITTGQALPSGTIGSSYSQVLHAQGGSGTYTWTLASGSLPPGVQLSSSGTISGTPSSSGTFSPTIQVSDGTQSVSLPFTLAINSSGGPTITTSSLPNGTIGISYSQTTLAASGGNAPYTWSVSSGALPSGLTLSSSGTISGTPAQGATNSNFTVQLTDSAQAHAQATFTVTITLVITTTSLPNGTTQVPYSQTLTAQGGSGAGYTWAVTSGALPTGLGPLTAQGTIAGTPSVVGTSNFSVRVTDGSGQTSGSQALTIQVSGGSSPTLTEYIRLGGTVIAIEKH